MSKTTEKTLDRRVKGFMKKHGLPKKQAQAELRALVYKPSELELCRKKIAMQRKALREIQRAYDHMWLGYQVLYLKVHGCKPLTRSQYYERYA